MKKYIPLILALILAAFGLLTLFLSTSIILDLFGIRAKEGNYVLFVVWSNFISSILYLFAAYGFLKNKKWTINLLSISTIILIASLIGLFMHIKAGGIYETKTVGAMVFRISFTLFYTLIAYLKYKKIKYMKNKSITLLAITLSFSLFLFACNNKPKEVKAAEVTSQAETHHDHETEAIELDHGKKWKVNENMMIPIKNLENDINSFKANSMNDYTLLDKKIKDNIELLTANCTMTGQAHDELHKWLLPFIDLSEKFSTSKNEQEFSENFQKIKSKFTEFNNYFE